IHYVLNLLKNDSYSLTAGDDAEGCSSTATYRPNIWKRKKWDRRRINRSSKRLCGGSKEKTTRVSDVGQGEYADRNSAAAAEDDSNRSGFLEEDYIVLCFREDGAIDLLNDHTPEASPAREMSSGTEMIRVNSNKNRTARVHDCCWNKNGQARNNAEHCVQEAEQREVRQFPITNSNWRRKPNEDLCLFVYGFL
ncbi:uncharacterized protein LOC116213621, partial [Punica granatum]|uniref:Uncharacterized protein LOC116213621 n=1 Tax=Punica granatum TaxID=22663 RepID=A0A6P8EGD2_PUNGR